MLGTYIIESGQDTKITVFGQGQNNNVLTPVAPKLAPK